MPSSDPIPWDVAPSLVLTSIWIVWGIGEFASLSPIGIFRDEQAARDFKKPDWVITRESCYLEGPT
jgi:hypothetical protein